MPDGAGGIGLLPVRRDAGRSLSTAQDHKRIWDDDRGPNTGGMGAFSPSPLVTPAIADVSSGASSQAVVDGMRDEGEPYVGFLYVSLMLTPDGPKVIEFNVRFGDPEAQVILPASRGPWRGRCWPPPKGGWTA